MSKLLPVQPMLSTLVLAGKLAMLSGSLIFVSSLPAQASLFQLRFSGKVTSVSGSSEITSRYAVNDDISIAFTFNPNYSAANCGTALEDDYYVWQDDPGITGCTTPLFSNISVSGTTNTSYTPVQTGATSMYALDTDSLNLPAGTGANPSIQAGVNGSGISAGTKLLTDITVPAEYDGFGYVQTFGYNFINSYLQPYVNVGSTIISPQYFLQYYYGSGSYYRNYAISNTPSVSGYLGFSESSVVFNLTGMDIITPIPSPLPILGAASMFSFARRLRKKVKAGAARGLA